MPALPCHPAMHLLSCVDLLHALHTHAYVSSPTPDCTQHQVLGLKVQTAEKNLAAEHRHDSPAATPPLAEPAASPSSSLLMVAAKLTGKLPHTGWQGASEAAQHARLPDPCAADEGGPDRQARHAQGFHRAHLQHQAQGQSSPPEHTSWCMMARLGAEACRPLVASVAVLNGYCC